MSVNIISPSQVYFINCFPITRSSFDQIANESDFISKQVFPKWSESDKKEMLWEFYCSKFLTFYLAVKKTYCTKGFKFIEEGNPAIIKECLEQNAKVIIIFAHNTDPPGINEYEKLEMRGKPVSSREIEVQIPREFEGAIDLSSCHVDYLSKKLRISAPNAMVKSISMEQIDLVYWLYFYNTLFHFILINPDSYVRSYQRTIQHFKR